MRGKLALGGNS